MRGTRVRNALALIVVLVLAATVPAVADVVYVGFEEGSWTLFRAAAPGDEPTAIRPGLAFDASAPAISPDGSQLAFEVPGRGILVCPLAGEAPCDRLTTELGWPVRPTWNRDSGDLVFVRYVADATGEDSEILVAAPDLTAVRPLVTQTGNQDHPDLSPDGRLLVYDAAQTVTLHRGGATVIRHLWVMDLVTGAARPLVPAAAQDMQPDVSPDGRRVVFASDRGGDGFEIWVVGLDGDGLRQVTGGEGSKSWPAWSPDGETILYTRAHEGRTELWRTAADGSAAAPLEPFGPGSEVQTRDPDWR